MHSETAILGTRAAAANARHSGLRKRLFAWALYHGNARYERWIAERKRALLGGISGTVAEIGPGAGANLGYFADGIRWIGIEPNPHMRRYLAREAAARKFNTDLRAGTAEATGLASESADTVVSTLVLCSVDDPAAALAEVLRILRPGGEFRFIEHVVAPEGSSLRRWQHRLQPLVTYFADGCHPDRDTGGAIERAGFAEVAFERFDAPLPLVRPHISGVARKAA